jgi:hypothetical protein
VSRRAQKRTTQPRTSQLRRAASLFLAPTAPELELCNSPSIPSPIDRFFAWQGAEANGERTAWFTHCLLLQPDRWRTRAYSSIAVRLRRHPERHTALHASVSVQRHLSRIFPAFPRSLASVLIPRPAATARLCFFGFQKIFSTTSRNERGKKRFSEPSENASLGLGSGAHSRRFAQECPEGNPGKYKQGETQWHSTKTTSS